MPDRLLHHGLSRSIPWLVAIALGLVLTVTNAPAWVAFLCCPPLVFFGLWWRFIR